LSFSAGASKPIRTPVGTQGRIVTGERNGLQPIRAGDEHALGRAPAGDLRAGCHMSRGVQRRQRTRREFGQCPAARRRIAEHRDFRHVDAPLTRQPIDRRRKLMNE
jgi:hypothetical protein